MKTIVNVPTKQSLIRETRDYLMIALGLILYGIGWTVFLLPNDITTGGVPGIASIVYFATGFPVQYTYFSINRIQMTPQSSWQMKLLATSDSTKVICTVSTACAPACDSDVLCRKIGFHQQHICLFAGISHFIIHQRIW